MNRAPSLAFRVAIAAIFLVSGTCRMKAQEPASTPSKQETPKPEAAKQDPAKKETAEEPEEEKNPFAPEPAPALPPGMKGSDTTDPRANLTPGLYDAGETSMGIKHLLLLKKPDAFQLGATDPDDPKVQKTISQLGIGNLTKLPKAVQLPIAQLAFANSDFAFQGNHLFQGNFYGVNIYDISSPANATLLTSMICPGGQGDVSVYKNLLFMSVEMPNGRLDCGTQGFPPEPPPPATEEKEKKRRIPAAQTDRFRGVRIFDISDITVYPAIGLAAGACSGNGILLDIKDPVHPKRLDAVNDPNYSYWHSASFSNDGTKVIFTDEWGGGLGARCRPNDPNKWGADAIFHLKDNKLSLAGYYKLPAAQGDTENCVAHNGSLIPVPGRDIEVQAWYQGGISVMDFTDAAHPFEIAYFDPGPVDPNSLVLGGDWSAYWYKGRIKASEIARGLDVFQLTPTKFLTQNEIDAAKTVRVAELNVQNQQKIEWPAQLVVAKAYLDQLERSQALPAAQIVAVRKAIESAEGSHLNPRELAKLKGMADSLEQSAATAMSPGDSARLHALAEILKHPAA